MENQAFASPGTSAQVTVVAQQPITADDPRHKNRNILRGLGITEILIGSLSFFLATIAMIITGQEAQNYINRQLSSDPYYYNGYSHVYAYAGFTYSAQGMWCGILIIMCGILGVKVKDNPTKCMYIANMIMTIIVAVILFGGTVVSGCAAAFSYFSNALKAIHSAITLLLFAVFVIAVVHSAFCCSGACYSTTRNVTRQYVANPLQQYPLQQAQYVMGPNGQVMTNQVNRQMYPQMMTGATAYPQVTTVPFQQPQTSGQPNYFGGGSAGAERSKMQW